jgi:hypothetical protein
MVRPSTALTAFVALMAASAPALAQGEWEITPESEQAAQRGLEWLARNQGPAGNWQSNDLGLVALGALAFLSDGHTPEKGKYGPNVRLTLDYILSNVKPSGLLNISGDGRDMYNHGLATFVLTQAYGMTNDKRTGRVLARALRLICDVQCGDGGWDYKAVRLQRGHDLSLAVMQAKALRGAMDMGLEIPPRSIDLAIKSVREHYKVTGGPDGKAADYGSDPLAARPGQFTYDGNRATTAMGAAGVVCLQEFGKYEDFRIYRSIDAVINDIHKKMPVKNDEVPFDAYTLYYVAQGLYQVGGERWRDNYPKLRDALVKTQNKAKEVEVRGSWQAGSHVGGEPGRMFGTSVGVFVLCIPNRYLPILQEGRVKPADLKTDDRSPAAGR